MIVETRARSVAKAVSYRLFGSLATAALVFAGTGRAALSAGLGALDAVVKIGLYFVHERAWNLLSFGRLQAGPAVVWFTGLSGAGKSTLARRLAEEMRARGMKVELLDGDELREILPAVGFTKPERDAHVRRVGHLAGSLERHGVFVVAALVSPYAEARADARARCRRFVEVHVATPLAECERRDPKGLYARARRGEILGFTGIDDPYEPPARPEVTVDAARQTQDQSLASVLAFLDGRGASA